MILGWASAYGGPTVRRARQPRMPAVAHAIDWPALSAPTLFETHLDDIEAAIRVVCRQKGCSPDEAEDFRSFVHLKLLEDDCRRLAAFKGRSTFATYLQTVLLRLLMDHRNEEWGSWRPSKTAKRLGPLAVRLETLIQRDERSVREAVTTVAHENPELAQEQIEAVLAKLPRRLLTTFQSDRVLALVPDPRAADDKDTADLEQRARELEKALADALQDLAPDVQLALRLRSQGVKVVDIAKSLAVPKATLYTRLSRVDKRLAKTLSRAGFPFSEIRELLQWADLDLDLESWNLAEDSQENRDDSGPRDPSNMMRRME